MEWRTRGNTDYFHSDEKNFILTQLKFTAEQHQFRGSLTYIYMQPEFFKQLEHNDNFRKHLGRLRHVSVEEYSARVPYSAVDDIFAAVEGNKSKSK